MPNALYRQTLAAAWRLTRRHKYLWFFGIFAVVWNTGVVSGFETFFNNLDFIQQQGDNLAKAKVLYDSQTLSYIINNVRAFFGTMSIANLFTLLLILGLFVFFVWMAVVSQGALIASTEKLQREQPVTPESAFKAGTRFFWPIFWLNVLRQLITTGLVILLGTPLLSLYLIRGQEFWATLMLFLNFLILVPLAMVIAFLMQFAAAYVILRGQTVKQSIRSSWKLFSKHWLATLEMGLILFLIAAAIAFVYLLLFFPNVTNLVLGQGFAFSTAVVGYLNVSFILLAILSLIITGVFAAFQYAASTLFFLRLEEGTLTAKLIRWFGHWGNVGEQNRQTAPTTAKKL